MAWATPRTWTTGETVTAAMLNSDARDNTTDLDRRTTMTGAIVDADGTRTSTSYGDASTVGPAVNVVIGTTRKALLGYYANLEHDQAAGVTLVGITITGATTLFVADDTKSLAFTAPVATGGIRMGMTIFYGPETLTAAGSTTFSEKVRVAGTAGTGTVRHRRMHVTPLGS